MVSGFVTSPDDQSRICFDDASPIRIASKSLMSINFSYSPSHTNLGHQRAAERPKAAESARVPLIFEFQIRQVDVAERSDGGFRLFLVLLGRRQLHVVEIAQRLVGRHGHLAVLVDALLALLELLGGRLAADG